MELRKITILGFVSIYTRAPCFSRLFSLVLPPLPADLTPDCKTQYTTVRRAIEATRLPIQPRTESHSGCRGRRRLGGVVRPDRCLQYGGKLPCAFGSACSARVCCIRDDCARSLVRRCSSRARNPQPAGVAPLLFFPAFPDPSVYQVMDAVGGSDGRGPVGVEIRGKGWPPRRRGSTVPRMVARWAATGRMLRRGRGRYK